MAVKAKVKTVLTRSRNAERHNGKARKQRPGVSVKAFTGRTVGGFTPQALERRAERRTVVAAAKAAAAAAASAPPSSTGPTDATGATGPGRGPGRAERMGRR